MSLETMQLSLKVYNSDENVKQLISKVKSSKNRITLESWHGFLFAVNSIKYKDHEKVNVYRNWSFDTYVYTSKRED